MPVKEQPRKSRPATRKRKRRTPPSRKKVRKRLFGTRHALVKWSGGILAAVVYAYVFYAYVVSPFAMRWRGMYGEPEYPKGYSIHGIDISHHQGKINWEQLQKAQIDGETVSFVFIKATEGKNLLDENFNDNFYQAREYGFIRGAYHYFKPDIPAKEQAEYFLRQVHLEEGDLPPVLDIEEMGNLGAEELRRAVRTWLAAVERRYGIKPILYTYHKFKTQYLNGTEFDAYPYWIAHYYVQKVDYPGNWRF